MSEVERSRREEPEEVGTAAYVTVALGIGLLVAAVLIIITAGTAAAGFPFVLGAAACLGIGISRFARQRRALPASGGGERELLSELATEGHLLVESREGSLFYSLPRRSNPQLEGYG